MFASTSHEFRTPLNSIINSYDLISDLFGELASILNDNIETSNSALMRKCEKTKQLMQKYIRMGKSSSIFLLALVEDVLNLSKLEAGTFESKYEEFYMKEVFEEVDNLFHHQ